jgi:hypothetical protein
VFERTKAAVAKAKEHLAVAELLAQHKYYGQAYAHVALSLEEASVAGIRLLTEAGVISWEHPPPWFKIKETELAAPGKHLKKLGMGLVSAAALPILGPATLPPGPLTAEAFQDILAQRHQELTAIVPAIRNDPVLWRVIVSGQARKEAAFYSTPRGRAPAQVDEPNQAEYERFIEVVRPWVLHLDHPLPDQGEWAKVRPLFAALFAGNADGFVAELESLLKGGENRLPSNRPPD